MLCPNCIPDLLVSIFSERPGCEKVLPEIITTLDATVQKSSLSPCRSWRQNQAMPGWNGIKREGKRERIIVCSFFGAWSATADLARIYWAYSEVVVQQPQRPASPSFCIRAEAPPASGEPRAIPLYEDNESQKVITFQSGKEVAGIKAFLPLVQYQHQEWRVCFNFCYRNFVSALCK